MNRVAWCIALVTALLLAQVVIPPATADAAPRATQAEAQACDAQPVVDTTIWTDGVTFTLRECARGLFKIVATKMKLNDWAIESATVREQERVDLMGHWTIPTYRCSRDGSPTMSCG